MIGFRCECGAAIDCTYPNCNEGVEMGKKDITERLRDYANDYTTTTYHDDLIREAVTEIESLRQQLAVSEMTTPQTAHALALIAAAQARIAGMQAENQSRQMQGYSLAYGEDAFFTEASHLEQIAVEVINQ